MTEEGHGATLPMQAADVLRILASVGQMIHAGNRVVFDQEGSYIQHKASGKVTQIHEKGGNFVFNLRVKKGKPCVSAVETASEATTSTAPAAAAGKSEQQPQHQQHFGRQATIVPELCEDQY